jgi:monoamine oxidase
MERDVGVIGAGVAGLACAAALKRLGFSVTVIEAKERVGGRILTLRLMGEAPIEVGAQVIHGHRAATWPVVGAAGLRTAPMTISGDFVFVVDGRVWRMDDVERAGIVLPWSIEQLLVRGHFADCGADDALESLGVKGLGRSIAREWLSQIWCADPVALSVAGMSRVREASTAGDGEFVVLDGYDRVPQELARGIDVQLGCPVRQVRWHAGGVSVEGQWGTLAAHAAVVTVPPNVVAAGDVSFDPPLERDKADAARSIAVGSAFVVVVRLKEPSPLSRWALVVGPPGGFWRAKAGSSLVVGWMRGPGAAGAGGHRCTAEWAAGLTGGAFPWLRVGEVAEMFVHDWCADPYARGGYSFPRVGALDAPSRWASPLGNRLFFAGEATCGVQSPGSVHGALESGRRAAAEVAAMLSS